ncbi:MAG TPA: hypothetical protein P5527_08160, partial [Kiritimatiellia bacterium]|nr:hypothetical protein [Kiritimatiellia bacterium]
VERRSAGQQAAALGAAAVAGVGAGIWTDFGIVDEASAVTDRHAPDAACSVEYERVFARYCQAAEMLGEWAQE